MNHSDIKCFICEGFIRISHAVLYNASAHQSGRLDWRVKLWLTG